MRRFSSAALLCALTLLVPAAAHADPYLCDASAENCRTRVLTLIANEKVGIDVSFWFMDDSRYSTALVKAWQAGVPVRVIMDPRANASKPVNAQILDQLQSAGIPMRKKNSGDIAHWKGMIFAGQNVAEFSGANYSPYEYVPQDPYIDYNDEAIYFSDESDVVQSLMRHYDDVWTDYSGYADYANVTDPTVRNYPLYPIAPEFNFPPDDSYYNRLHPLLQAEGNASNGKIDVTMYRITDSREANDLIAAAGHGVPVRLYTEPNEYRNPARIDDSYNVDRMYMAGVQIRMRAHTGLNHQKTVLLYSQGTTVFGTSNWSTASDDNQLEVNYFTTKSWFFQWFQDLFERKWNNSHVMPDGTNAIETKPFTPLPPDKPQYSVPANAATGVSPSSVTLKWYAGYWARQYDIYVGTSSTPRLYKSNVGLGPSTTSTQLKTYTLPALQPGTTYYWQIVSKTMANMTAIGPVWSFTTSGTANPNVCADLTATNYGGPAPCVYNTPPSTLPSPWTQADIGSVNVAGSASYSNGTFTVRGAGNDIWYGSDAFHYVYQPLNGDGQIVARVASVQNVNSWTKAGVMIRNTLDSNSAFAIMLVSAAKGTAFQYRTAAGASAAGTSTGASFAPYWVKVVRSGTTFTGYQSPDGNTWTTIGSATIAMGSSVYVGLAVTSHNSSATAAATFDNVTVGGGGPPPPPSPPGTPATPSPADGATGVSAAPTLTWTSTGGTSYDVALDTSNPPAQVAAGQTSASYAASNLAAATKYYWQIVAHNSAGTTAGPVWSFTTAAAPPPNSLPAPWVDADIGAVGVAGSASYANGTFTVNGAGADIWNTTDAFHYVYQPLNGDGALVARVASIGNVYQWSKAGVMIRSSLDANSAFAYMLVSAAKGTAFHYRKSAGATATGVNTGASAAPYWVQIVRSGSTITGYQSADGSSWTPVGSASIAMGSTVYIGLAVTSHDATQATTGTFDGVSLASGPPPSTLPSPWTDADIGAVGRAGSASYSNGAFSVIGSGADIWNTADEFHFVYKPLSGDGQLVARVASVQNVSTWSKAGVMIRDTLDPSSAYALMLVSAAKGTAFQYRATAGDMAANVTGTATAAPYWVKIVRSGDTISGYQSPDGSTWQLIGTTAIPMGTTVQVGLAVTSHNDTTTAKGVFDNVQ